MLSIKQKETITELKEILIYRKSTDPEVVKFDVEHYFNENNGITVPVIKNFNNHEKIGTAKIHIMDDCVFSNIYLFNDPNYEWYPSLGFRSDGKIFSIGLCDGQNIDPSIKNLNSQI